MTERVISSWKWNFRPGEQVELVWNQTTFGYSEHVHEDFDIDLVQAGLLEYRLASQQFVVGEGQMVWINPNEVHRGVKVSDVTPSLTSLLIPKGFMDIVAPRAASKTVERTISNRALANELVVFQKLANSSMNILEVEIRLIEWLSYFFSTHSSDFRPRKSDQNGRKAVRLIKDYLLEHFTDNVRLSDLSNIVHLSRPYIVRLFRQEVGLPPYSYLTQIRMEKARKLLVQGMNPAEVAVAVGFSDQSHLIRFFRRSTGITPGAFLKEQRGE